MYGKSIAEGKPTPCKLIARREPKLVLQLNLFLHNNTHFVMNVVPFREVFLGLYTTGQVIATLKRFMKCIIWNSGSLSCDLI